jgi:nucleotide-binding universal stress UspA family protein
MVRSGRAAEAIVRAAVEEDADLVLMTTRGGSPVKRWLVGGVTEQVLRLSPVPVLTVRSQTPLPHQARVRRIILPLDGSRLAEAPLFWAKRLAKLFRAKLVFLHVYPVGAAGHLARNGESFAELRKRILAFCSELRAEGVKAAFKLQRGDPAERILIYPDRYDLILTTTHGFGGFKRWVFGSVAEKLIHASEVPVLVWKTPAQVRSRSVEAAS